MKTKIVHCINDDKFLDNAIFMFNSINSIENKYYIISEHNINFVYLRSTCVEIISSKEFEESIIDESFCNIIIIHGLGAIPLNIIPQINRKIKVIWFSWGYDIYSNSWPQFKLIIVPRRVKDIYISRVITNLKCFIKKIIRYRINERKIFIEAIERVDYYSGVFDIEYDLLRKHSFFKAEKISFNYCNPGYFLKESIKNEHIYTNNNILIGNSASYYSNHLDCFRRISNLNIDKRKLIVPLSYGNSKSYVDRIRRKGEKLFGDNFIPLINFMPYEKYNQYINSCSIAIFNIEQQAAVGNIIMAIWNGCKVFMPKKSMGYKFFNNKGIKIYSIEDELIQNEIDTYIQYDTILNNREIIHENFSFENVKMKLEHSLEYIKLNLNK